MLIEKHIFGDFKGVIILDINLKNSDENGNENIDGKGIIVKDDDMTIDNYRIIRPKNQG